MMEARLVDSYQPDSPAAPIARRESRLIRSVNSNLRERSETFAPSERIAFFCECQNAICYSPLWMSVAAFDAMVAAEAGWLLLEGHEPSALWHRREPLPTPVTARWRRRLPAFSTFLPVRDAPLSRVDSMQP
jgi:hypothetical protein